MATSSRSDIGRQLESVLLGGTGTPVARELAVIGNARIPRFVGEFWTSKQRQASSIHEISYRACFKPQLPRFFIERFSGEGDVVYDPFSGRGTTVLEAGLLGRRVAANDANPLSELLVRPRFFVPRPQEVEERLASIPVNPKAKADIDLSMFYHPATEAEIVSLRRYLNQRREAGEEDDLDRWIRMVATNRLTGHSAGFFSVYTLPPNQAVTPERQIRINERLRQKPEYRSTREIIMRKTVSLVRGLTQAHIDALAQAGRSAVFLTGDARHTPGISDRSVQLVVTSPPFLDVVQYAQDNWLRCWFNGIDAKAVGERITMARTVAEWAEFIGAVFQELYRVVRPGGWVAFEVGEVRKGSVKLDEHVVPLGLRAGFECEGIMVNLQEFTKTSHIWGVDNNRRGTNTNRIVVFRKAPG